jgi:hypothetical protein
MNKRKAELFEDLVLRLERKGLIIRAGECNRQTVWRTAPGVRRLDDGTLIKNGTILRWGSCQNKTN